MIDGMRRDKSVSTHKISFEARGLLMSAYLWDGALRPMLPASATIIVDKTATEIVTRRAPVLATTDRRARAAVAALATRLANPPIRYSVGLSHVTSRV